MNYEELTQEIRQLSVEERKALISFIVDTFTETKDRSLLELEGLGAEIWEGIDAQEYVNQLRSEWDDRP
ncbi:MAG TPA: hypothetical protein VK003_11845 [Oceanobacillus sp.]|nr:hypothetical protein [Oceanobacillus sp.]